ncbi:pentapeptide repeat-containing protein [Roseibium sp. M-1]
MADETQTPEAALLEEVRLLRADINARSSEQDARGAEKNRCELEKLRAETAQLKATLPDDEEQGLRRELLTTQVALDKHRLNPPMNEKIKDWVKVIASVLPLLTVVLALGTLMYNMSKDADARLRDQRATISELGEGLSHANPATRIAKANALAPFINDTVFQNEVASILVAATLEEEELTVRSAFVQVLSLAPATAFQHWTEIRHVAWSALEALETQSTKLDQAIGRSRIALSNTSDPVREPQLNAELDQLEGQKDRLSRRINNLQHGVVALVVATRSSMPMDQCGQLPGCDFCRADFKNFYLKDFDFFATGLPFCNADFSGANLESANYSRLDLKYVRFVGSRLREAHFRGADLTGADFEKADLSWEQAGNGSRPLVTFEAADLNLANFKEACLSGADFRNAETPPTISQIRPAYALGASFDEVLKKRLEAARALKRGPKCQTR